MYTEEGKQRIREIRESKTSEENKQIHAKAEKNFFEKHGCTISEWALKYRRSKYEYDGIFFDSSWELAFYVYIKSQGRFIKRSKKVFHYFYNGDDCRYFPDFEMDDGIQVEIKGRQFFENGDENGRMICLYDRSLDEKYEAKHQCMLQNGVVIYSDTYIRECLAYCESIGFDLFQYRKENKNYENKH